MLDSHVRDRALEAEIKSDETIGVVEVPGWLLNEGITVTHSGDPVPGWFQYDDGIQEQGGVVTHVGGAPLEPERVYQIATKVPDLTNGQSPPFTAYFTKHPEQLPPKGAYNNIHAELMGFFARNLWRKIWEATTPEGKDPMQCDDLESCMPEYRLSVLDRDETGVVRVEEIHAALRDVVGLSVDDSEMSLAKFVHSFADTSGDGRVTLDDFKIFCTEMPVLYENERWRLASPRPARSPVQ